MEGLIQQLENSPALSVVREVSTEPQTCIGLARVRVFLLQELSFSGTVNNTVTYKFYSHTISVFWLILNITWQMDCTVNAFPVFNTLLQYISH